MRTFQILIVLLLLTQQGLFGQLCENPVQPTPTGEEIVFAEAGGVQLVSKLLTPPCEGFSAVIVEAQATAPGSSVVTFTNLRATGGHQVWSSEISGTHSILGPVDDPDYNPVWAALDSHFRLAEDESIGGGVYRFSEANDGFTTDVLSLPDSSSTASAVAGHGAMTMQRPIDALFLTPEFQRQQHELAYLVASDDSILPVQLQVGVLGTGIQDAGTPNGAEFGYQIPIRVPGLGANENATQATVPLEGPSEVFHAFPSIALNSRFGETVSFPFSASSALDANAEYGLELVSVNEVSDPSDQFFFNPGPSYSWDSIPAGTTARIGQFRAEGKQLGEATAEYQLTFSDGSVVDAEFSVNVVPRGEFQGDCETTTVQHGEVLVDRSGCVEIVSVPQKSPAKGLAASKIVARSMNPHGKIITLTNLSFSNVHQVWTGGDLQSPGGTAFGRPEAGALFHEDWIEVDSHFLISKDMIAGGVYGPITEQNDGSNSALELPTVLDGQFGASAGFGEMSMDLPTDAFFLHSEFQRNELDIAYIVRDPDVPVSMTIGLLGSGFVDGGTRGGAEFGVSSPTFIPLPEMVPEPSCAFAWIFVWLAMIRSCVIRKGRLV